MSTQSMSPQSKWCVVVWAVVPDDLELFLEKDIREARTALEDVSEIDVHVFESAKAGDEATEVLGWTAQLSQKGPRAGRKRPRSLREALQGISSWNLADHRLLVLWGHGKDAFPASLSDKRRSAYAVPDAAAVVAAFSPGGSGGALEPPDIVGYDACRMATVETAFALEALVHLPSRSDPQGSAPSDPRARFLIGSMVPEPATGWPYFQAIQVLSGKWSKKPAAVANSLVEAYAASVQRTDWCMSAINLTAVGDLRRALKDFVGSAPVAGPLEFFEAAQGADISDDTDRADLGALMGRLNRLSPPGTPRYPLAETVRQKLRSAIACYHAGGRLTGRDGMAVRIALPTAAEVDPWTQQPQWGNYMPQVLGQEPARKAAALAK